MTKEYRIPEVVEIGTAEDVILGVKGEGALDTEDVHRLDSELDD
jgi:hypothetical protein